MKMVRNDIDTPAALRDPLVRALYRHLPVFITSETTGLGSEDVLSAVSIKPLGGESMTLLMYVADQAKVDKAVQFLGIGSDEYDASVKFTADSVRWLLSALSPGAGFQLAPMTYNVDFQLKYLEPQVLNPDVAGVSPVPDNMCGLFDLVRFGWCIGEAPALQNDLAGEGHTLDDIGNFVDSYTAYTRGVGYKKVMPMFVGELPSPLKPSNKPELLEDMLLSILGMRDASELLGVLCLTQPADMRYLMSLLSANTYQVAAGI